MSELDGGHLHEGIVEALTWETQVLKIKNTIVLNMTRQARIQGQEISFLYVCYDWLARVLDIEHLVRIYRAKLMCKDKLRGNR